MIDNSWDKLFNGEYGFNPFDANVKARKNGIVFPNVNDTFNFANIAIKDIKCVIVGMEPYASWFYDNNGNIVPQATGRSFEVAELKGKDWTYKFKQASLRNMGKCVMNCVTGKSVSQKEFRDAIINKEFSMVNPSDWFANLEKQGVCFLNAALTVEKDVPGTGAKHWNGFGKAFVDAVKEQNKNVVWFLFGLNAQNAFVPYLTNEDKVVIAPHPRMASFSKTPWFNECPSVDWTGMNN